MPPMLLLRNLVATILIPGTVVGLVPYVIVFAGGPVEIHGGASTLVGTGIAAAGAGVLLWCVTRFAVEGQGTLAPIDPPTRLVGGGLYRYSRNPMYVGALLVLVGEYLLVLSSALLVYIAFWFLMVNLFVMFYEEPTLRRTFGAEYEDYCRSVRRWI